MCMLSNEDEPFWLGSFQLFRNYTLDSEQRTGTRVMVRVIISDSEFQFTALLLRAREAIV